MLPVQPAHRVAQSHAHPFRDLVVVHGGGFPRDGRQQSISKFREGAQFKFGKRPLPATSSVAAAWSSAVCPSRLLPLPRPSAANDATWVGRSFGRTTERGKGVRSKRQTTNAVRTVTPDHMCERCAFSCCSAASVKEWSLVKEGVLTRLTAGRPPRLLPCSLPRPPADAHAYLKI